MSRRIPTLAVATLLAGLPAQEAVADLDWSARAAAAQDALVTCFWNPDSRLFRTAHPADPSAKHWHYWWQAHAIDALVDGYERSRDESYLTRARDLWQGVQERNSAVTNDYYDDMLWMALALQRLRAHGADEQLARDVRTLWNDVHNGWNDAQGGGIAWRKQQLDYKNAPANAPAVILGARLFRADGNDADLEFAQQVHDWMDAHLVDSKTGFVWDGMNRQGDGRIDRGWAFTYNQGLWIGANVELFRATGEDRYLEAARRTFAATRQRLANDDGVLTEHGGGDGALFKGVLVRYLGKLAAADPESRDAVRAFLLAQAESLWKLRERAAGDSPALLSRDWRQPSRGPTELSAQLSGVMLLEQVTRLGR